MVAQSGAHRGSIMIVTFWRGYSRRRGGSGLAPESSHDVTVQELMNCEHLLKHWLEKAFAAGQSAAVVVEHPAGVPRILGRV